MIQVHLYTNLAGLRILNREGCCSCWTKDLYTKGDIHFSVDLNEYKLITHEEPNQFTVEKIVDPFRSM